MNKNVLLDIVKKVKQCGADEVEILLHEDNTTSVTTRLTKLEKVIQASALNAKMRVSVGKRSAIVSTDSIDKLRDTSFIENAVSAARNAPEELVASRPDIGELCHNVLPIDTCDDSIVTTEQLIENATRCETLALSTNGITNSEGAETGHTRATISLIRNNDFWGQYKKTYSWISLVTLAEKDGDLQNGYDFAKTVYYSDLKSAEAIAKQATERTLRKLGGRKIPSCKVPVVFEKKIASQLLNSLLEAISGASVAKDVSFLKDKLSKKVFGSNISVTDLDAVQRGLRSRPFDSDGLECQITNLIVDGVINSFLLNTKYANQLHLKTTRNASGFSEICANNVIMKNGTKTLSELISPISQGLYVTEVMGNGLNMVTGNYSQGAAGFWIENGQITYPVHEITIAGNFIDMLSHCEMASDLDLSLGIDSPTILVEEMVVGGL